MDYNHVEPKFMGAVAENKGCAVILAGSGSDDQPKSGGEFSHLGKIVAGLERFNIPLEVRICSAHKQPNELYSLLNSYNDLKGALVIIAVAGGTDALSGTASFHSLHPVISCPPDAPNQSCWTNPPGSSNLYLARPEDVGRAVAQLFSHLNPNYREKLRLSVVAKKYELVNADLKLSQKYGGGWIWSYEA